MMVGNSDGSNATHGAVNLVVELEVDAAIFWMLLVGLPAKQQQPARGRRLPDRWIAGKSGGQRKVGHRGALRVATRLNALLRIGDAHAHGREGDLARKLALGGCRPRFAQFRLH